MLKHHVMACLGHLVITVIICLFACQCHRVALHQSDMPVSLERIFRLIEERTVTSQRCPFMTELHITLEHLRPRRVRVETVIHEHIGMNKINPLVSRLPSLMLARAVAHRT